MMHVFHDLMNPVTTTANLWRGGDGAAEKPNSAQLAFVRHGGARALAEQRCGDRWLRHRRWRRKRRQASGMLTPTRSLRGRVWKTLALRPLRSREI